MTHRHVEFSPTGLARLAEGIQAAQRKTRAGHPSEDTLFGYVETTLQVAETQRVQSHLDVCPSCALRLERFERAAKKWDSDNGAERLEALRRRVNSGQQHPLLFPEEGEAPSDSEAVVTTSSERPKRRIHSHDRALATLIEADAIERGYDYVLPSGVHSGVHINVGKICRSERLLGRIVALFDEALQGVGFDTIVSTGWAMATIARRLVANRRIVRRQRIEHVMVEGYETPALLKDLRPGARVVLILDVVVTGTLISRVVEEVQRFGATIIKAVPLVQTSFERGRIAVSVDALCEMALDLSPPDRCSRCRVLERVEFNPIAYRMTKKKSVPRSPSEFLKEDPVAHELWDLVDKIGAYEHHRIIGKRHYIGFVDTMKLLRSTRAEPSVLEKLCRRIVERSGVPELIVVPAGTRGTYFGKCLTSAFDRLFKVKGVRLVVAKRHAGVLSVGEEKTLKSSRVLVADVAAGEGDTIDGLALLASYSGAASVAGAVLLSRLSEACEESLDARLSGGFSRLYSVPVRPITARDKGRQHCPICWRRRQLRQSISELPAGPFQDAAKQFLVKPRFRRWADENAEVPKGRRQMSLFPMGSYRRGIASGIALHALHSAMGDGMAPLSLPELRNDAIPPSNRAAMVENLPPDALAWSGSALVEDLHAYLRNGGERIVWLAIAELFARAGSPLGVESLETAIPRVAQHDGWMDERFWARMACAAHQLVDAHPSVRDQVRNSLENLVNAHQGTPASEGLAAILATVSVSGARIEKR